MSRPDVLVDADWVEAHQNDPGVAIVEVDEGTSAYDTGHIANAIKIDGAGTGAGKTATSSDGNGPAAVAAAPEGSWLSIGVGDVGGRLQKAIKGLGQAGLGGMDVVRAGDVHRLQAGHGEQLFERVERRRQQRVGLGPGALRRRADHPDDLDTDAPQRLGVHERHPPGADDPGANRVTHDRPSCRCVR